MKDLFFKVKKVNLRGITYTGIVLPYFENKSWDCINLELSTNKVCFLTFGGEKFNLLKDIDFQTTRITDKKLKELIDNIINVAKEDYKIKMKIIELCNESRLLQNSSNKKSEDIDNKINQIIKHNGFIDREEFIKEVNEHINISYDINYVISDNKILKIEIKKVHDLGNWIKEGQYSFLYIEYDDNICVCDEIENDKQLKDIKSKYFKNLMTNKISGYSISENFYPQGGGDKRSACVCQEFEIDLKSGIELKKENVEKLVNIFRELFLNLK